MHSTWKLVGLCPIRLLTNCSSGTAHMSSLWNKFQKFRFSAAELGKVRMSDSTTMDDRTTTILKATADTTSMNSTTLPSVIEPAGMSRARADYLYKQIRPHCHEENRDITCPDPSEAMEEWCSCFFSVLCSQHTIHCIFYDNTNLSFTFLICFWCNYGFLLWLHNLCTFCKFCTFDLPVWNELYVWNYWLWVSQICILNTDTYVGKIMKIFLPKSRLIFSENWSFGCAKVCWPRQAYFPSLETHVTNFANLFASQSVLIILWRPPLAACQWCILIL